MIKEIHTNEQLMKFLFVELLKDYIELVISSNLPRETIVRLTAWLTDEYDTMTSTNQDQPLGEFVTTFLHAAYQAFPDNFPATHSTAVFSLQHAQPQDYLENLNRAVFTREDEPVGYEEHLEEWLRVISRAIGAYLSQYRKTGSS